jgi:hypothetical protein
MMAETINQKCTREKTDETRFHFPPSLSDPP